MDEILEEFEMIKGIKMKSLLLLIALALGIFASSYTEDSVITLPERIDENGIVQKERTVSYEAALVE